MDDTKKLIEKYKRELMEMSRTAPVTKEKPAPAPEDNPAPVENPPLVPIESTAPAPEENPAPAPEENPASEERSAKAPQIIGYVTEDGSEFSAMFDKFITDAAENSEIETVSAHQADEELPEPQQKQLDSEPEEPEESEMSQGSGESISNFPVPEYSSIEEFEANNTGGGFLEFRVFEAEQALPIEGAKITVTVRINGKDHPLIQTTANNSGETGLFTLPAPSAALSQNSENKIQPFSLYDATVNKEGYTNVIIRDIPIFDGVQSVQRIAMLPAAAAKE